MLYVVIKDEVKWNETDQFFMKLHLSRSLYLFSVKKGFEKCDWKKLKDLVRYSDSYALKFLMHLMRPKKSTIKGSVSWMYFLCAVKSLCYLGTLAKNSDSGNDLILEIHDKY